MKRAANIGVSKRATNNENSTAAAAVQPNSRKNLPVTPGMNATGTNTATSVAEVAMTAMPISSVASMAACSGGLPIARWRATFSTSTMASSTRMPTTTANASKLSRLSEKSNQYMTAKVGITDSGSAIAEIQVARQSRKKNQTTRTASNAPSSNMIMEELYEALASSTLESTSVNTISGCATCSAATATRTASPTATSLEPRVRRIEKPTTGCSSSSAAARGSAVPSVTVAIEESRTERPSGSGIG